MALTGKGGVLAVKGRRVSGTGFTVRTQFCDIRGLSREGTRFRVQVYGVDSIFVSCWLIFVY